MTKTDFSTREDIDLLVRTFYGKVRAQDSLGPIFTTVITDWEEHMIKLVDFWQTNLLFEPRYKGNPMQAHIDVDRHFDGTIQ
ncbi:MAG: group III truncated hemoglobin [Cyclobacteriaceae bacterium]